MTNPLMSLKLLVDKTDSKVVFAEANKDFVDFLFYVLTLPIGAIMKLLAKEPLPCSLSDLYRSINNLNDTYIVQSKSKDIVFNPKPSTYIPSQDLFSLIPKDIPTTERKFYRCSNSYNQHCQYVTEESNTSCPNCRFLMSEEVAYVAPSQVAKVDTTKEDGYVKGVVTYMVMDDLIVKPMSTISAITLLNKLSIKDVGVLEEKEVPFGMSEGLKLLKVSFEFKNVLTRVFLGSDDHVKVV